MLDALANPDPAAAKQIRQALLERGPAIVPQLLDRLPDAPPKACWEIIHLLGKLGDERAVPAVVEFLEASTGALRVAAAQCLGEIGHPSATPALLETLHKYPASSNTVWVLQALGRLRDPRAVDALLATAAEADTPSIRYTAIEALGNIGDPRALAAIEPYRDDPSHHVRRHAEVAIERLRESQAASSSD